MYLLGLDAGNTKTVALIATSEGKIIGTGRGGCGDIYGNLAIPGLEAAIKGALLAASLTSADLTFGAFSMAGADWPEDFDYIERQIRQHVQCPILLVNDAIGALRAGSPDGTGVIVVCGTGAATGACSADGQVWHSSFWQDPQGGHQLGLKALKAIYRAELGIDPPTTLTPAILRFFDLPNVEAVLHMMTQRETQKPDTAHIARLSRILLDEASRGDSVALKIVQEHGVALGDYALAAARQVGIERSAFHLVLAGGVTRHPSHVLGDALIARVRSQAPGASPLYSDHEPVIGALLLAFDKAGILTDQALFNQISASKPPDSFFAT